MLKWTLSLIVAGTLLPATGFSQTYYRYVTESGSVAYTDELKRVPARYRPGTEKVPASSIFDYARTSVIEKGASTVSERERQAAAELRAPELEVRALPTGQAPGATVSFEVEPGVFLHVPAGEPAEGEDAPVRVYRKHYHDEFGMDRMRTQISKGDKLLVDIQEDADPYRKRYPADVEMPFDLPEEEGAED